MLEAWSLERYYWQVVRPFRGHALKGDCGTLVFLSLSLCSASRFLVWFHHVLLWGWGTSPQAQSNKAMDYGLSSSKLWAKRIFSYFQFYYLNYFTMLMESNTPIICYHAIFQSYNSLDSCSSSIEPSKALYHKNKDLQLKSNNSIAVTFSQEIFLKGKSTFIRPPHIHMNVHHTYTI